MRVKRNALLLLRSLSSEYIFHSHLIFLFSELISPGSRVEKLHKIFLISLERFFFFVGFCVFFSAFKVCISQIARVRYVPALGSKI